MRSKILPRPSGFTLIESMALIAALAFVVVVAMPLFLRQRENARRSSCQSNLKQIALGVMQYVRDYDEKFPIINGGGTGKGHWKNNPWMRDAYGWADELQPYLKSVSIYQCSAERSLVVDAPAAHGYVDYYYNTNLNARISMERVWRTGTTHTLVKVKPHISGTNLSDIVAPAKSILFGEGTFGDARYNRHATEHSGQPPADERHLQGGNYAFCDGHVKWLKRETIFNGAQPATSGTNGSPTNLGDYAATHLVR